MDMQSDTLFVSFQPGNEKLGNEGLISYFIITKQSPECYGSSCVAKEAEKDGSPQKGLGISPGSHQGDGGGACPYHASDLDSAPCGRPSSAVQFRPRSGEEPISPSQMSMRCAPSHLQCPATSQITTQR